MKTNTEPKELVWSLAVTMAISLAVFLAVGTGVTMLGG